MVSKKNRSEVRVNKHRRIRSRLSGTPEQPRLAVFRSNNHIQNRLSEPAAAGRGHKSGPPRIPASGRDQAKGASG